MPAKRMRDDGDRRLIFPLDFPLAPCTVSATLSVDTPIRLEGFVSVTRAPMTSKTARATTSSVLMPTSLHRRTQLVKELHLRWFTSGPCPFHPSEIWPRPNRPPPGTTRSGSASWILAPATLPPVDALQWRGDTSVGRAVAGNSGAVSPQEVKTALWQSPSDQWEGTANWSPHLSTGES